MPDFLKKKRRGKHPLKVIQSQLKLHHQIQRIRGPCCRRFKLLFLKMGNLTFFARRKITDAWLFACFVVAVFFQGLPYRPSRSRASGEGTILKEIENYSALFK